MAGGIGSRLWPASTPQQPKQFIDMLGTGRSLIQLTVERFLPVCDPDHFWVVTSRHYVDLVRSQLPAVPPAQILAEPEPRNTAPCIAYACWKIAARVPDAHIVVTPADAIVRDPFLFGEVVGSALDFAAGGGRIVTIGISPDRPETGYGYICAEGDAYGKVCPVQAFKEKPDLETARAYLAAGNYYWNAGIFVWTAATIMDQIRRYAPGIAGVMDRLAPSFYTEGEEAALEALFPQCEKISIDYAVMEKSPDIHVIAADFGWSDLGSWSAVRDHLPLDEAGNGRVGEHVRLQDCSGCIVHAPDGEQVAVEGLKDCIVAVRDGAVLVCRLSQDQQVRQLSQGL